MFRVTLAALMALTLQSTLTLAESPTSKQATNTRLWCEVTVNDNGSTIVQSGWLEGLSDQTITIAVDVPTNRRVRDLENIPFVARLFLNKGIVPKPVMLIALDRVSHIKLTKRTFQPIGSTTAPAPLAAPFTAPSNVEGIAPPVLFDPIGMTTNESLSPKTNGNPVNHTGSSSVQSLPPKYEIGSLATEPPTTKANSKPVYEPASTAAEPLPLKYRIGSILTERPPTTTANSNPAYEPASTAAEHQVGPLFQAILRGNHERKSPEPIANSYFAEETKDTPIVSSVFSAGREDPLTPANNGGSWARISPNISIPGPPVLTTVAESPSVNNPTQEIIELAVENGQLQEREDIREQMVALNEEVERVKNRLMVTQVQLEALTTTLRLQTTLRLHAEVAALVSAKQDPQQLGRVLKLLQRSLELQADELRDDGARAVPDRIETTVGRPSTR